MDDVKKRIIVALDVSNLAEAEPIVNELAPHVGCFKIGMELMNAVGTPVAIAFLHARGAQVFVDGKFKDIPNTVAKASAATSAQGVAMFNVHASGGIDMMRAAVENKGSSLVLAVTVLTSFDDDECYLAYGAPSKAKVLQFARDAKFAGVDGIICSPQELEMLDKHKELKGLQKITPGVRPRWASTNDQKRVMTPTEAMAAGADALVIGRPLTNPPKDMTRFDAAMIIANEIRGS